MVHMIEIVRQGKVDFPHQVIVSFKFFLLKKYKRKFLIFNMVHLYSVFCFKNNKKKSVT